MYAPTALPDPHQHAEFYDGVTVKRGLAWIVDVFLVSLITGLIVLLTLFTGLLILPVIFLGVDFLYRWVSLARKSATPGMRLVGILFLDRFGQRLDAGTALLHTIGYYVSGLTLLVQVVSIGLMFISSRGQGLTDHILGTVAINRPSEL
jgi:uncharacterized RDD family membrane protein YckC